MNYYMDFDPHLIRERNEEMLAEVRSVRLEVALREKGDQQRKEKRTMVRNAVSKVMWAGRAAVFMVGFAVTLALVLGVATTALGATGATFILGKVNSATTPTSLVSTLTDATESALSVTNKSGGPALDLSVGNTTTPANSVAPMKVNSTKMVTNLNADQLDGKSEEDFYAAGSKVADSSHADKADYAASAKEAFHASHADSAISADSATNAQKAKSADSATLAQNASNANKLDGKDSTDFAAAYKRTVVVSPTGTDTQSGQALLDALNGITDASATKKYLLYIEPGTYDLGSGSLQMKPHVDIQGAGELNTIISSGVSSDDCTTPTVRGANSAELRFLTVRNTGTGTCNAAIYSWLAPTRLTHVTAEATGAGGNTNYGVYNNRANFAMTNVTATASGGTSNYGVYDSTTSFSATIIRQSKLSGTNASLLQGGGTAKVALTQLVGPVRRDDDGTLQCFNNYDQNLAAVTCP